MHEVDSERMPGGERWSLHGSAEDAIEVEISDTQGHLRVDPAELAAWCAAVLTAEGHRAPRSRSPWSTTRRSSAINRRHLGHDWPTDVISFPLSEPDDPRPGRRAGGLGRDGRGDGREIGVDPWDELALYVVHGLLHLCGYDDLSDRGPRRDPAPRGRDPGRRKV